TSPGRRDGPGRARSQRWSSGETLASGSPTRAPSERRRLERHFCLSRRGLGFARLVGQGSGEEQIRQRRGDGRAVLVVEREPRAALDARIIRCPARARGAHGFFRAARSAATRSSSSREKTRSPAPVRWAVRRPLSAQARTVFSLTCKILAASEVRHAVGCAFGICIAPHYGADAWSRQLCEKKPVKNDFSHPNFSQVIRAARSRGEGLRAGLRLFERLL